MTICRLGPQTDAGISGAFSGFQTARVGLRGADGCSRRRLGSPNRTTTRKKGSMVTICRLGPQTDAGISGRFAGFQTARVGLQRADGCSRRRLGSPNRTTTRKKGSMVTICRLGPQTDAGISGGFAGFQTARVGLRGADGCSRRRLGSPNRTTTRKKGSMVTICRLGPQTDAGISGAFSGFQTARVGLQGADGCSRRRLGSPNRTTTRKKGSMVTICRLGPQTDAGISGGFAGFQTARVGLQRADGCSRRRLGSPNRTTTRKKGSMVTICRLGPQTDAGISGGFGPQTDAGISGRFSGFQTARVGLQGADGCSRRRLGSPNRTTTRKKGSMVTICRLGPQTDAGISGIFRFPDGSGWSAGCRWVQQKTSWLAEQDHHEEEGQHGDDLPAWPSDRRWDFWDFQVSRPEPAGCRWVQQKTSWLAEQDHHEEEGQHGDDLPAWTSDRRWDFWGIWTSDRRWDFW